MIFGFIKRIFSSDNIQSDSIIMTDPKEIRDISFYECNFKLWNDDFGLTHIGYPGWWLNEAFQNLNKED